MANRLTGKPRVGLERGPRGSLRRLQKGRSQPAAAPVANRSAGQDAKPEWQIRRETGNGEIGSTRGGEPGQGCAGQSTEALRAYAVRGQT